MTAIELERKATRFTTGMNRRQLCCLHELIEDFIDARDAARISKRIREGKTKTVPWEEVKARLNKKFGYA